MAEPTTTLATGSVVTTIAAFVLQVTGVDLPPLVWSLIGAALLQGYSTHVVTRWRAIVQVTTSGFTGALIGVACAHVVHIDHRHTILLMCAVGGAGAHPIMQALVDRFVKKVEAHE